MKPRTCDNASASLVGQNEGRLDATLLSNEISEPIQNRGVCNKGEQQAVEQAVVELLKQYQPENGKRWKPRVPFVRPVSISFKRWRCATQQELLEREFQESAFCEFQTEIAAISTDISLGGVGIVTMYELLPSHVTLAIAQTVFACEVHWHEKIGPIHHRFGLRFQDVLDKFASNG